jgi:catechol 2,3-dioxygenase-like lactoylglutathione lyase family enzyme
VLDHISVGVSDLERSARFYDAVLGSLELTCVYKDHRLVGYGPRSARPWPVDSELARFWLNVSSPGGSPSGHIAFVAFNAAAVDRFHQAGLSAGGADDGAPGIRPHYHPNYYAAYLIDPDGHRLEATYHYGTSARPPWKALLAARSKDEVASWVRAKLRR